MLILESLSADCKGEDRISGTLLPALLLPFCDISSLAKLRPHARSGNHLHASRVISTDVFHRPRYTWVYVSIQSHKHL